MHGEIETLINFSVLTIATFLKITQQSIPSHLAIPLLSVSTGTLSHMAMDITHIHGGHG